MKDRAKPEALTRPELLDYGKAISPLLLALAVVSLWNAAVEKSILGMVLAVLILCAVIGQIVIWTKTFSD